MNSGLLTFPKSDQLLRGGDLLKLNKHINGFPLPAAHPKIVNGLHAFPKQEAEYGVYFFEGTRATLYAAASYTWQLLSDDFTIEFQTKLIKVSAHGFVGSGHSSLSYNNTIADGWGFCNYNDPRIQYFKIQDVSLSLVYQFNLVVEDGYHTHTVVRKNSDGSIKYYYDGSLITTIAINTNLSVFVSGSGTASGFNQGLSNGFACVAKYLRISKIARSAEWIYKNSINKFAIDANVSCLYNCYSEAGDGTKIINIANSAAHAYFATGSASPIWVAL